MLLAAAGQAAPYTYESSATRKINNNNNNISSNNSKNNVSAGTSTPTTTTTSIGAAAAAAAVAGAAASTSNAASALMKTLSVRLHRGTEFIKDTVQKALVLSATTTPVIAPPTPATQSKQPHDSSHKLKRKIHGIGGVMGTAAETSLASRQFVRSQPYIKPTPAYLRHFAVAPSALHRSASARKRNTSTDSLLMDLCMFKPIRPMPLTPIKINKARGFELKRPKFKPPTSNLYSDDDDDEDDDDDDDDVEGEPDALKEPEVVLKPKLSTLTLPQSETASAFVPHEAGSGKFTQQTKENSNTHTSGTVEITAADTDAAEAAETDLGAVSAKPKKVATKRRRRAPLLTAKRRRKPKLAAVATVAKAKATKVPKPAPNVAASKRKRRTAAGAAMVTSASTSISPMRPSPPMTRQRARLQISTSK